MNRLNTIFSSNIAQNFSPPFSPSSIRTGASSIAENSPSTAGNFSGFSKESTQFPNSILDAPITSSRSNFSSTSNMKRWRSVPMGMNFIYSSVVTMSPSSISSSCSDSSTSDETATKRNLESTTTEDQQKIPNSSFYLFERRPSSASATVARHRRSMDTVYGLASPLPIRLRDRGIEKLKREANIRNCIESDYAVEKLSVAGAAIMGSLDEFNIDDDPSSPVIEQRKRTQSLTEPVHVLTNFLPSPCSPSPTRIEKQCYSPSMQQVVRGMALSPATSPSPGRHHCVRSLSPIAVRGSLKRRYDSDTESCSGPVPIKRFYSSMPSTPPLTLVDRFSRTQGGTLPSTDQSFSINCMDSESSNSTINSDYVSANSQNKSPFYQPLQPALNSSHVGSPSADVASISSVDLADNMDSLMDDT